MATLTSKEANVSIDLYDTQGIPGPQGPQGPQGSEGDPGPVGPQGPQGPAGPKGDQGDIGPQGSQGPIGETGAIGATGVMGPQGEAGPTGSQGPKGDKGDRGDDGEAGPEGPKGDPGDVGPVGPVGSQGETGTAGPKGDKGDKGDPGEQGPKGDIGPVGPEGPPGEGGGGGLTALADDPNPTLSAHLNIGNFHVGSDKIKLSGQGFLDMDLGHSSYTGQINSQHNLGISTSAVKYPGTFPLLQVSSAGPLELKTMAASQQMTLNAAGQIVISSQSGGTHVYGSFATNGNTSIKGFGFFADSPSPTDGQIATYVHDTGTIELRDAPSGGGASGEVEVYESDAIFSNNVWESPQIPWSTLGVRIYEVDVEVYNDQYTWSVTSHAFRRVIMKIHRNEYMSVEVSETPITIVQFNGGGVECYYEVTTSYDYFKHRISWSNGVDGSKVKVTARRLA